MSDVANSDLDKALDQVAAGVATDPTIFVTSNGVRLKLRKVSRMVIGDAARKLKTPRPPKVFIEEKGREEENPMDPNYVQALQNFRFDAGVLAVNVYFVLGTKVIEPLPDDISPISADDWAEDIKAVSADVDIPSTGPRRYLAWLKFYVLNDDDQEDLMKACMRYSGGTLEADVEEAQASFRTEQARDTAVTIPVAAAESRSGDQLGEAAGNGTGVRGEGSSDLRLVPVARVDPYTE